MEGKEEADKQSEGQSQAPQEDTLKEEEETKVEGGQPAQENEGVPTQKKEEQLDTSSTLMQTDKWLFWKNQPVPKFEDPLPKESGPIDRLKTVQEVQQEPYKLPGGYEWVNVNLHNQNDIDQLYTLLVENYVEDEDNMFRFDYSREFLKWALTPPGQYDDWLVGVRVIKSKKLVGFISGIPVDVVVKEIHGSQ